MERAKEVGRWLNIFLLAWNNTVLGEQKFRYNVLLHYHESPKYLPEKCDACTNNILGPAQDFTYDIIIWYVFKIVYLSYE